MGRRGGRGRIPGGEVPGICAAVRALPEVREERVRAIREALSAGTYRIDARAVAQRMIDEALAAAAGRRRRG